jgi:nitrogen fixation/metabolism regulation signal transduction histidine kinase
MADKPRKAGKGEILSDQISENFVQYNKLNKQIREIYIISYAIAFIGVLGALTLGVSLYEHVFKPLCHL